MMMMMIMRLPIKYVPLISELDDQECKEIAENVAQLEEAIEESAKKKAITYLC